MRDDDLAQDGKAAATEVVGGFDERIVQALQRADQRSCRKLIKARGSFPNDEAAIKLLYLGLRNISQRWTMPILNWKPAMSQFMIRFETQFNQA